MRIHLLCSFLLYINFSYGMETTHIFTETSEEYVIRSKRHPAHFTQITHTFGNNESPATIQVITGSSDDKKSIISNYTMAQKTLENTYLEEGKERHKKRTEHLMSIDNMHNID